MKSKTCSYHVEVTHHEGSDSTHHVGRFASKKAAEETFSKKFPQAHKVNATETKKK